MRFKASPEDLPSDELRDQILEKIESIRYFGKPSSYEGEVLSSLEEQAKTRRCLSPKQRDWLADLYEEHVGED